MNRAEFADFLRKRREALQPEDVGLGRGPRRRTNGLRREEVAALVGMSADYYARMERGQSPQPSEQMVAAIARGLRLSLDERDYLFQLAGHRAPRRVLRSDHIDVGLMRVLDRLDDTPAQIMTALGETLGSPRRCSATRPHSPALTAARSTAGSPTPHRARSIPPRTMRCTPGSTPRSYAERSPSRGHTRVPPRSLGRWRR